MAFCNCHGLVSLEDCSRSSYQQIPKHTDTGFGVAAIHNNGNALPGTEQPLHNDPISKRLLSVGNNLFFGSMNFPLTLKLLTAQSRESIFRRVGLLFHVNSDFTMTESKHVLKTTNSTPS